MRRVNEGSSHTLPTHLHPQRQGHPPGGEEGRWAKSWWCKGAEGPTCFWGQWELRHPTLDKIEPKNITKPRSQEKTSSSMSQISWGIALSYSNSEEPREVEFLLSQCLLRTSEWHQLRRDLAGCNLLILCHLHPISQQCQLSALELFKFSSSPSVSAAEDCRSFSRRRKPVQPLSLQSFKHHKMSLASLLWPLRSTGLSPVHLSLPGLLGLCTGFPLLLMNLHTSWVSLPPHISLCPHAVRRTAKNSFVPRQKRGCT